MIQPIPTWYAGHKFRSRLEARWAVFFDTLGMKWIYEPDGYTIGPIEDRIPYLPDFWLPTEEVWVEVKGKPTARDARIAFYAGDPQVGLPGRSQGPRLLMLGNIPHVEVGWLCWQHMLTYCPEAEKHTPVGLYTSSFSFASEAAAIEWDGLFGIQVLPEYVEKHAPSVWNFEAFVHADAWPWPGLDEKTVKAYRAARSARFEHGQSGGSS